MSSQDYYSGYPKESVDPCSDKEEVMNNNTFRVELLTDGINFKQFMECVFEEEVDSLRNTRNEEFARKREYLRKIRENMNATQTPTQRTEGKIGVLAKKEAAFIKERIRDCENEEELCQLLCYIRKACEKKENRSLFAYNEFPLIISKIIKGKDSLKVLINSLGALAAIQDESHCKFYMFKPAIPKLCQIINNAELLLNPENENMIYTCLYLLSVISGLFTKKAVRLIMKEDISSSLISFLNHEDERICIHSLEIIGNICSSNNTDVQSLIDEGLIPEAKQHLAHPNKKIRKEVLFIFCNIATGTQSQIESLIDENIFPNLKEILSSDEAEVKTEAIWAISTLSNNKNPYHAEILIEQGIIQVLLEVLINYSSPRAILLSLEAIKNFLEIEAQFYQNCEMEGECSSSILNEILIPSGLLERLDELQYHKNVKVSERVGVFLEKYLYEYTESYI